MKQRLLLWMYILPLMAMGMLPLNAEAQVNTRIYVTENGSGTKNGTSWADAADLSAALEKAEDGTEIWVAAGEYKPKNKAAESDSYGNNTTDRDKAFVIPPGVKVYGGFAGTETALEERDWVKNVTTLSGDLNGDDTENDPDQNKSDNCYHVVIMALEEDQTATLDGFTITGGNADGSNYVTVNGIYVYQAVGGGVYATGSASLTNNTINGNTAGGGGGVYATGSASLTNNTIYENIASDGGGVYAIGSASLANNMIYENIADFGGGVSAEGKVSLTNNTIHGNTAKSDGGGVYATDEASLK